MTVRLGWQPRPYDPISLTIRLGASRVLLEEDIEKALAKQLALRPTRQLVCCGLKPDLVLESRPVITIVEIKRDIIGERAVEQITRYVEHWAAHLATQDGNFVVYGIVAAPRIRPRVARLMPSWCAFAPLDVQVVRGAG